MWVYSFKLIILEHDHLVMDFKEIADQINEYRESLIETIDQDH